MNVEHKLKLLFENKDTYEVLHGRKWCEENKVDEQKFIEAVKNIENVEWGVSPMYPWKY